jgi:hypothetical protein
MSKMANLTEKQRKNIERLARMDGVSLYRETSYSGISETLRYRRIWVEETRFGKRQRVESHMVFSVPINVLPNGKDDPNSLKKYTDKCNEAERLFKELRHP